MNKKLNLEMAINILSLIQSNEKWNIDDLIDQLGIKKKELIYLLSIVTDIYSQHGELLIDYEYNEENQEFLFNINSSIKNVTQINDGELFNIYFLLSTNSIYKQLIIENKDVKEFYDVLSNFFNIDIFDNNNNENIGDITFFEENVISYIKLGTLRENLYRIQPISLTTNSDGIVLEAIDLDDETYKTFLLNRIIDVFDNTEFKNNKKTKRSIIELKFNFEKETVLNGFNQKNIKVKGRQAIVTFYSESNALNFALNHFNDIEIITPQSIANEISIRKTKLIKKLKV
ncbi:MAG: hypothetical protein ACJ0GA_02015 [Candidatus Actinomarina sp.]|tara:strand:+ start:348 stop:1208 length:861 start_codon:yes stop_codon:yes gene_type:complete